jgi:hypothetical protein
MASEVTLREFNGSYEDCLLVVTWRNEPENARAFPEQEPWTVSGQQAWYNDVYRHDPSLNLYFVCLDDVPIGTVGMSIKDGKGEMMWMILGDKRLARGGYMRQGMRKLLEAYGLAFYWGRVIPDNKAGLRFQLDNGFKVTGTVGELLLITRDFDGTWPDVPAR